MILVHIPSKQKLRLRNLFGVDDAFKMHWQSNGDYLAVERSTKTQKGSSAGFDLFRINELDIPVEVLDLENKNDKIIDFSWEPKGHRFAVIHGDDLKPDISFYSMGDASKTGKVSKLITLRGRQTDTLHWSPTGRFIILSGLNNFGGRLEFYDVK